MYKLINTDIRQSSVM